MKVKAGQPLLLIFIFLIYSVRSAKQIDTFNVLLPQIKAPNQGRPLQLISSEGACLEWATTAPQTLKITGIADSKSQCYRKALLQLSHVGQFRSQIYVTAKNGNNDQIIVPVRIRQLKKISIATKSRMMNINEKQDLTLYGYDADQNRFTSLEGLKFKWDLIDPNNVLQKISLKDSHLILSLQERKNIQSKGYQSDIIVAKGLIPGKVPIKVTCIEPGYQHLTDQILISVHQRFEIIPSVPSYVLVDSSFQYSLATPSGLPITLPKNYYKATINSNFQVSNNLLVKAPKSQSHTILKVQDIRTSPSYNASAQIFAKEPDEIKLIVDQYILVGQQISFIVQLYWNKKLLKGRSSIMKIQTQFQLNTEKMTIKSLKKQSKSITVSYRNLKVSKTIHSVLPIKGVIPDSKLHLPVQQTYQLRIVGGSGVYQFSSSQSDYLSISNGGLIFAKRQGNFKIKISDKKLNHYVEIPVIVTQISTLAPLEYHKQLNKNVAGPIFISALNAIGPYTECDDQHMLLQVSHYPQFQVLKKVQFKKQIESLYQRGEQNSLVKTVLRRISLIKQGKQSYLKQFDKYVVNQYISLQQLSSIIDKMQNYGICSIHMLKSYKQFEGSLQVYLKSNVNIKRKFNLRVYKEIVNQIEEGDKEYFIMTPLSSVQWKTSGGSFEWVTPTKVLLNNTPIKQKYPIISCPNQPKYLQMKIQYRNQESTDLLFPVSQSKNLKIDCKFPSSIKIRFLQRNMHEHHTYVVPKKTVKGHLYPLDSKLSQFYNSSNLIYKGQIQTGSVLINGNLFSIQNKQRLKTKVIFSTSTIKHLSKQFSRIQTYFIWQAAQMFSLNPSFENSYMLTMFNQKQSYQFYLANSSQYIDVQCKQAVSCTFIQQQSRFIRVSTQKIGNGTLMVRDKWLYGMPEINSVLDVVQANQMVLQSNRNSIQVSKILPIKVWLYNSKRLIPVFQYPKSDIQLLHDAGIRIVSQANTEKNEYYIKGQKSGNYIIQAEQHSPKFLISSNSLNLIVYEKMAFNIANLTESYENQINVYKGQITIPTNCLRRIKISGGPINIQAKFSPSDYVKIYRASNNKNKQFDIEGLKSGQSNVKIQIIEPREKKILAILILVVKTAQIEKVAIYALNEALIGAQFRMIPYLIIDERPIIQSQCELKYEWLTSNQQGLKINQYISYGGVNVTAIRQGQTLVELKVITKKKQVLLTATKKIIVHQSLDLKFPTLIGQDSQKISSNMLLPPNSGYQFESHHSITKISQCQQSLLTIDSNKITTSRQKGIVSVKIKNNKDQSYNSYINIIVTDIKGLFIENFGRSIDLQIEQQMKLNFYVMDMYGRQFYNKLFNIEYAVVSSNEDVLTASISKNKQQIILHPHKIGTAKILLRLKSINQPFPLSSIGLINAPHDILQVQVGKILQPASPIYVCKGGYIFFVYTGDHYQKWEAIQGDSNVRIDQKNNKVYAQKVGESVVSINNLPAIIRVIQIDRVQPLNKISQIGSLSEIQLQFHLYFTFKQQQYRVQAFNQQYNYVNNNLNVECRTVYKNWFDVTTQIRQSADGQGQQINCIVRRTHIYPQDEKIPSQLILTVHVNKKIIGSFEYPLHMTFMINKRDKNVLLTSNKPSHQIRIKTTQRLQIDLIQGGQQSWYSSSFSQFAQVQIIKISIPTEQVYANKHFRLRIQNTKTGQNDQIQVRYIIDGQQNNQNDQESNSQGMFSGYQWTDFIIVIMALLLLLIMLYQVLINGNKKFKEL